MKLVRFLNGGVSIEYLDNLMIPEVLEMLDLAMKIYKEEERLVKG